MKCCGFFAFIEIVFHNDDSINVLFFKGFNRLGFNIYVEDLIYQYKL